jgi:nucleolar protein 6
MAKRKSTADETPAAAVAAAADDISGSKKRRRLSDAEPAAKKSKKEKKSSSKKERKEAETNGDEQDPEQQQAGEEAEEKTETPAAEPKKKQKKQKKNKKGKKGSDDAAGEGEQEQQGETEDGGTAQGPGKKNRYIVFVGNIPYSATVADIERHFSAVQPISVRLLHEKANPTKSRGIAFVEFGRFDHMKTCLKTMHHTIMKGSPKTNDGGWKGGRNSNKVEERQINVELTAGGGGAKDNRKEKIRAKNEKLTAERERRAVEEERVRVKKEQERLSREGERKGGQDGIHPSRRNRVPGGRR